MLLNVVFQACWSQGWDEIISRSFTFVFIKKQFIQFILRYVLFSFSYILYIAFRS